MAFYLWTGAWQDEHEPDSVPDRLHSFSVWVEFTEHAIADSRYSSMTHYPWMNRDKTGRLVFVRKSRAPTDVGARLNIISPTDLGSEKSFVSMFASLRLFKIGTFQNAEARIKPSFATEPNCSMPHVSSCY